MKTKIYYITRSFSPYQKGGGPLLRNAAVENLRKMGWDITVVMPAYQATKFIHTDQMIQIPFRNDVKFSILLQMIGVYEDYLDKWVKNSFEYLKNIIKKEDIVFTTTGGELGTIKLGSLLQKVTGCQYIVNFRDPIDYTLVNNQKINKRFHVSREKNEKKYLQNADLVITSSKTFQNSLQKKYPHLEEKIVNNYFGYITEMNLNRYIKKSNSRLKIAYVGNMESAQKPEILLEAYYKSKYKADMEIYFIGDYKNYAPLQNIADSKVYCIEYMSHNEFLKFMRENIDIGFVSLANEYYSACFPSKIYEYINLGIPILGALPDGDAKDFINHRQYGIADHYDNIEVLTNALDLFMDKFRLNEFRKNILNERAFWAMSIQIEEVHREMLKLKDRIVQSL